VEKFKAMPPRPYRPGKIKGRSQFGAGVHGFTFPYVIDETQDVARTYDAQCTPDFFGFNAKDELQYRGRLDASRMTQSRMPDATFSRR